MSAELAQLLVMRIDRAPLFAHAYAHHLNLRFGAMTPFDLLDFAADHRLAGLNIHVEDGECASLRAAAPPERRRFGAEAAKRGLRLHVETSSTTRDDLEEAVAIARDVAAESVRCYPRHAGRVSQVVARTIDDLRALAQLDAGGDLRFTLEQHEDLKSHELVGIVRTVGNPRLSLLFDFGNMINADERPSEALAVMAPFITEAHIKDVRIVPDRGGAGHLACHSGEGDLDFHALLRDLLLLGNETAQVRALALEEEDGLFAPAYRFPGEEADPVIPARGPSLTPLPENETLEFRLARERRDAERQVAHVRRVLDELRQAAVDTMNAATAPRGHQAHRAGAGST